MTPLAHQLIKQLIGVVGGGCSPLASKIIGKLTDIHPFDLTDVEPLIADFAITILSKPTNFDRLAFLPAPKTWLEFRSPGDGRRWAVLLEGIEHDGEEVIARCSYFTSETTSLDSGMLPLTGSIGPGGLVTSAAATFRRSDAYDDLHSRGLAASIYAALSIINSPNAFGRRQHNPHRGLQRALLAKQGLIGHFPLRGWVELKLQVNTSPSNGHNDAKIGGLTGRKCQHYCRKYLRFKCGKWEHVPGHWKGDPFIGIKFTKYRLVAPCNS